MEARVSIPFPFEVFAAPAGGFTWRIIGACGRSLVYTGHAYPSDLEAAEAAKAERERLAARAALVDAA
jgi:hypothetical protein